MSKTRKFLENFIVVMIITAILEMFIEDFSRLFTWNVGLRKTLVIIGFLLDLIFSIEFILRSILSRKDKGWIDYFLYKRGWVDLISSLPLILFNSGPIMIGIFFPGKILAIPFLGMLNILKITKILRIARLLRLLRLLKMFRGMSDEVAKRRQENISRIISIIIVAFVSVLLITAFFPSIFYNGDTAINAKNKYYATLIKKSYKAFKQRNKIEMKYINRVLNDDKNVIFMYDAMGQIAVNHINTKSPSNYVIKNYFYTDFNVLNIFKYKLWYSLVDEIKELAKINLLLETIIIIMIMSLLLFYKES